MHLPSGRTCGRIHLSMDGVTVASEAGRPLRDTRFPRRWVDRGHRTTSVLASDEVSIGRLLTFSLHTAPDMITPAVWGMLKEFYQLWTPAFKPSKVTRPDRNSGVSRCSLYLSTPTVTGVLDLKSLRFCTTGEISWAQSCRLILPA